MRRLDEKQIEVADAIVDKLVGELGDEIVAIWLFDWEQKNIYDPFFHVICSLDGDDHGNPFELLFHNKHRDYIYDWIEEIEKTHDAGYIEISVVYERGDWGFLYYGYDFDKNRAIQYYNREQKTIIRDRKFMNGKEVNVRSEFWAMNCKNIRRATPADAYRIAEIEVFNYRLNFYPIFRNDDFYFGELNVKSEAEKLIADEEVLQGTYVWDDGVIKGFIIIDGDEVWKLYVEPVLQRQGIGSQLLEYAEEVHGAEYLWALEKNERAIRFYESHGFSPTGERIFEKDTSEFLIRMKRS